MKMLSVWICLISITNAAGKWPEAELRSRQQIVSEAAAYLAPHPDYKEIRTLPLQPSAAGVRLQFRDERATLELRSRGELVLNGEVLKLQDQPSYEAQLAYVVRVLKLRRGASYWLQIFPEATAQSADEPMNVLGQYILSFDKVVASRLVDLGKIHGLTGSLSGQKWNAFRALVPEDLRQKQIRGVRIFCDTDAKSFSLDSSAYRKRKGNLCLDAVPNLPAHRALIFFEDGSFIERRSVPEKSGGGCTPSDEGRWQPRYRHFIADYRVEKGRINLVRDLESESKASVLTHCCEQRPNCVEVVNHHIRTKAPPAVREAAEPTGRDRGLESTQ